jgi:hypothetical protein
MQINSSEAQYANALFEKGVYQGALPLSLASSGYGGIVCYSHLNNTHNRNQLKSRAIRESVGESRDLTYAVQLNNFARGIRQKRTVRMQIFTGNRGTASLSLA